MAKAKEDWYVQGTYDDIPQHDISGPHEHYQLALAWLEEHLSLNVARRLAEINPLFGPLVERDAEDREIAWTYRSEGCKPVFYRLRSEPRRKAKPKPEPLPDEEEDESLEWRRPVPSALSRLETVSAAAAYSPEALGVTSSNEQTGSATLVKPAPQLRRPRRLERQLELALPQPDNNTNT